MAGFPTTITLDNFNRADGGLGSSWTAPVGVGNAVPTIHSNVVLCDTGVFGDAYYNTSTFVANQEGYLTVPSAATATSSVSVLLCVSDSGLGSARRYLITADSTNSTVKLVRTYNNASSAALLTVSSITFATNWKLGARSTVSGNDILIDCWADKNDGFGWVNIGSYTDAGAVTTYPLLAGSGNIGFRLFGNAFVTRSIDDFGGGATLVGVSPIQETIHVTLAASHKLSRRTKFFFMGPAKIVTQPPLPLESTRVMRRRLASNFRIRKMTYKLFSPTILIPPPGPVLVTAPSISGYPAVGQTLTVDPGTWTSGTITFQWQQDNNGNGVFVNIFGENATTLLLNASNDCNYIRCIVTATNVNGSTSATTNVLGPIRGLLLLPDANETLTVTPKVRGSVTLPVDNPGTLPLITDEEC